MKTIFRGIVRYNYYYRLGLFVITGVISLYSCIPQKSSYIIDEKKIKEEVRDIISGQPLRRDDISQADILKKQEEFISNYFDYKDRLKIDAMHRLADLYLKMERNNLVGSSSELYYARSVEIYEKILSLYPERPENDSILYQLARIYYENGDIDRCIELLNELIMKYPVSIYRLEAYFRLGDIFFDLGAFSNASFFYENSIKDEDPYFYKMALYKLGWTYFNLQEYRKAIDTFISLIDKKRVQKGYEKSLDINAMPLREKELILDAINTVSLAFSYLGEPSKINEYFEAIGERDYEIMIYQRLASYYVNTKDTYNAIAVYNNFIEAFPLHEDAPLFQTRVIELYTQEKYINLANKARIRLIEDYNRDSAWYKKNSEDNRNRIIPIVKKTLKELALYFHSEAQASKYIGDYKKAFKWYRRFLEYFPSEMEAIEVNFLLAEGLFETDNFEEAATEYEKTAYQYQPHKYTKEAAYGAILSLQKLMNKRVEDDLDIDPYTKRFIKNCERFSLSFPDDSRTPDIVLKAGEILFQGEMYEDLRRFASKVIDVYGKTNPSASLIYKLQNLIADSLFKEKEYMRAGEEYRKARALHPPDDQEEVSELDRLLASSLYKEAERLKKEGKTKEAIAGFIKVYEDVPSTEIAPIALFDAGVLSFTINDIDRGIDIFKILLQHYSSSQYISEIPDIILKTGEILFYSGEYNKVRDFASKIMDMYKDSIPPDSLMYRLQRLIADSLFKEKEYMRAGEEYQKARTLYLPDDQEEVSELDRLLASSLYKEAKRLKKEGKTKEAIAGFIKVYEDVPSTEIAPIALFDAGVLSFTINDIDRGIEAFDLLSQNYPSSEYAYKGIIQLADIYESKGRFNEAAMAYERLAYLSDDEQEASDAIFTAGLLYEKGSNWDKVYTTFGIYIDAYAIDYGKVIDAMFKRANASTQLNDEEEARRIFQLIIDLYGQGGYKGNSHIDYIVARSYLIVGDYLLEEYEKVRLTSPLEENLERKNNLLEEVIDYYKHARGYKIAEITTASTYKIGMAFEEFKESLLESERPSELTRDQLREYNSILEEEAYPYQDKAIVAYESNVKLTHEFGLYDEWIKKSYESLSKIFPIRYQKRELSEIVSRDLSFNTKIGFKDSRIGGVN